MDTNNEKTFENDAKLEKIARVGAVIRELIGERSIRKTAEESGVAASYITGILKGRYLPSAEILRKLAMPKAKPQNGVTLEDLMIAAGYQDDYIDIIPSGEYDEDDFIREIRENKNDPFAAEERLKQYREDMRKYREESHGFELTAEGAIGRKLIERGIEYSVALRYEKRIKGYKPDFPLSISNHKIEQWWFDFKHFNDDKIPPNRLIIKFRLGKYMFLESDSKRKISLVINDAEKFDEIIMYCNHLSYRGDLSVILLDKDTYAVVSEVYLSHFDENDHSSEILLINKKENMKNEKES